MIGENAPKPDWWECDPHACPFESCAVCGPADTNVIPLNIELGEN